MIGGTHSAAVTFTSPGSEAANHLDLPSSRGRKQEEPRDLSSSIPPTPNFAGHSITNANQAIPTACRVPQLFSNLIDHSLQKGREQLQLRNLYQFCANIFPDRLYTSIALSSKAESRDMAVFYSYDANGTPVMSSIDPLEVYTPLMYGSVHQQEDPVGWYLTQQAIMKDLSVEYSTQITQSQRSEDSCDSYTNGGTPIIQPFVQFPDPEYIRHLHTLRSLLPTFSRNGS
ncbi:hypothetical protein EJ07DRAFT_151865 [Lizonia empirigonia]|nr:hypothetical protein EJ07DRAFT_151865 [Lizonia empirigonia]